MIFIIELSPTRCISPEPLFSGLLSSGADLVRRKLTGVGTKRHVRQQDNMKQQKIMLSRLERRALRSLKLVEKVESIGLENIIAASNSSCSSSVASDASSRGILDRSISPMRNLKQLHTNENMQVDDLHFDRRQIKGVLNKGLVFEHKDARDERMDDALLEKSKIKLRSKETTSSGSGSENVPLPSVTDTRLKQMQRQKSRRQIKQRTDLGTTGTGANIRNDLGKVVPNASQKLDTKDIKKEEQQQQAQQSITQAFVGSVSSLIFGRKGGWL